MMSEAKTYKVLVTWQVTAEAHVQAENADEAERKALGFRLGRFTEAEHDTNTLVVLDVSREK